MVGRLLACLPLVAKSWALSVVVAAAAAVALDAFNSMAAIQFEVSRRRLSRRATERQGEEEEEEAHKVQSAREQSLGIELELTFASFFAIVRSCECAFCAFQRLGAGTRTTFA